MKLPASKKRDSAKQNYGKIRRIGLMGYNSNEKMTEYFIGAMKNVLDQKLD